MRCFILMVFLLAALQPMHAQDVYEINKSMIHFYSEAPQELIKAGSDKLKGAIDIKKKTFVFKVGISSFIGFNSVLQREHFNENYMETEAFPYATFTGKIIEDTDLSKEGDYKVRAKGKLKIHGVERERIIEVKIKNKKDRLVIGAMFDVSLRDHNIKIPKVVYDKLAPDIHVTIGAGMVPVTK